jgi:uncharacterized protein YoxC
MFGRKKNNGDEFLEGAPVESTGPDMQDDGVFHAGLEDPDAGGSIQDRSKKKVAVLILAIGIPVLIGLFGWSIMSMVGMFKGNKAVKEAESQVQVMESRVQQLNDEKIALEKRVRMLEDRGQVDVEKKIQDSLAEAMKASGMIDDQGRPVSDRIAKMEEQQVKIEGILKAGGGQGTKTDASGNVVKEEPKPRRGSESATIVSPSGSPAAVQAWAKGIRDEEAAAAKAAAEAKAPFEIGAGIQRGISLPAVLRTTIVSTAALSKGFWVVAETTAPVKVGPGNLTLPMGVRFLGVATPDWAGRRMNVEINRLQYGDVDMAVKAILLDERGNCGIVTKYIDPRIQGMWSSLIPNLIAAFAQAAQDMTTYYDDNGNLHEEPEFNAKNAALQGTGAALQEQAATIQQIQREKQPVIIVRSGIPVLVQMVDKLPADLLVEAGVVSSPK